MSTVHLLHPYSSCKHLENRTATFPCPSVTRTSVSNACLNPPLFCKIILLLRTLVDSGSVFPSTSTRRKRPLLAEVIRPQVRKFCSQNFHDHPQTALSSGSLITERKGQQGVTLAPSTPSSGPCQGQVGEGLFGSHSLIKEGEATFALSSSLKTKCFL